MLGAILGFGYAFVFGVNQIFVRRGVLRVSSNYMATLTIFSGAVFFFLFVLVNGELFQIGGFNWKVIVFFALSGIIHFSFGRTFGYRAVQILGATRAGIMTGLNAVVSVVLAVIVLKELLTPLMVAGIFLSLSGPVLVGLKEEKAATGRKVDGQSRRLDRKTFYKGLLFGAGSALFWGSSGIFIKLALDNGGSSMAGSFIAYTSASLLLSTSLFNKTNREEIFKLDKQSLQLALMSGMTTNIAQMLRYLALNYGTMIMVSLVSRTMPIWTITLSFIFNRKLESFSPWVLLGNALLIAGTVLVLL